MTDMTLREQLADISILVDRRDLTRAQSRAQELLLAYPNSAGVHSLMGDIAAARRDYREAIDWYELSLRLEPNPQVETRLARQRELLEERSEAEVDQMLETPRDNRRLLIGGIIGGFVLVGILIALIVSVLSHGGKRATPAEPAGVERPAAVPGTPTTATTPSLAATGQGPARPSVSGVTRAPTALPSGAEQRSRPSGTPQMVQSLDAPMSDDDILLTNALSGITWPNGEALGWRVQALVEPYTGYGLISVEVPPSIGPANLQDTIIDMSYKLAVASIRANQGLSSLTLRVIVVVNVDRKERGLVAFRANTTRDNLDYYLKRGLEPDRQTIWNHVFATTWWNPSVPTGRPENNPAS